MQDRYAGDIGDFGKFALLKKLAEQGLSIGVNWYKKEPLDSEKNKNGEFFQDDGKYRIPDKVKYLNERLADSLSTIAESGDRSIEALEKANLIPNAVYYSETISVKNRTDWHNAAASLFEKNNTDLVFLDPDNGLLVKSVKEHQPRSCKYVFEKEIEDYINAGISVLLYNHRSRKPELQYLGEMESRLRAISKESAIYAITFPMYSVRDYFAITAKPEHSEKVQTAFSQMLSGKWTEAKMCRKPLTADITYTEYRARFSSEQNFMKHYQALPEDVVRKMIALDDGGTTSKACMYSAWEKEH